MRKFKKRRRKLHTRKIFLLNSILVVFMFLGIGYSLFSTELTIDGSTKVTEYFEPTLYNVLYKEAKKNGLAKEYTGSHQDSMNASLSTEKIYHWYANNNAEGTTIQNKKNVIFANHCWQMIRTTDTGGVKMIYNGEPENNQCLSTRGAHAGYVTRAGSFLTSNYWYGTGYTYDSVTKTFKVSGETEQAIWNETTGPGLIGKYTCKQTTESATCSTIYYIESYNDTSSANVLSLNSNSHYSQFGTLNFSKAYNSPSYVGYMYNAVYPYVYRTSNTEAIFDTFSLSTSYWYADSVTWGSPVANRYNLNNPYQVSSTADYSSLAGKYTFRNEGETFTNNGVYYIAGVDNTKTMYYIWLSDYGYHTLSDFNDIYTYGDSYTDNGDGTYTINNPTTIERKNWYTSYGNVSAGKYVCKNAVNNTCGDLRYIISTTNKTMVYIKVADNFKYAKGFTWDGSKYVLDNDTSVTFWNYSDKTNLTSLNNAHYTCWNETGECTTLTYIYYNSGLSLYYIFLNNGKSVEDAINEMLYNDDVNTISSTVKIGIDAWYKNYLLKDYDDYIEDIIYCNDRRQKNVDTNGWNPNGGILSQRMDFYGESDLSCQNDTDKFSVSNSKAKLTYKVGLMSYPEMNLSNNANARKTGQWYWIASPYNFGIYSVGEWSVNASGNMNSHEGYADGVRPAISLKPGTTYSTGDGSKANPYIVNTD